VSYLSTIYGSKPFTDYPSKLTRYLTDRYSLKGTLLDLGCGRGEFLEGFKKCGLEAWGLNFEGEIKLCYSNNTFDTVFSKSVLEHLYYPEKIVKEIYRILKPGGLCITMVPDWEANYKIYPEDYTHRTPFMASSLRDIFLIHGFKDVKVEKFRQLPFLWKWPWLWPVCWGASLLYRSSTKNKMIKFSKEIMLLGSAKK